MPSPCDPSPYRTIASALRAARDNGRKPLPATTRSKRALRDYLASASASGESIDQRNARVAAACANRFRDTHGDYAITPNGPAFNGSTRYANRDRPD